MAEKQKTGTSKEFNTELSEFIGTNINEMAVEGGDPNISQIAYDVQPGYKAGKKLLRSSPDSWIEVGSRILEYVLYAKFLQSAGITEADLEKKHMPDGKLIGALGIPQFKRYLVSELKKSDPERYYRQCLDMYRRGIAQIEEDARLNTVSSYIHDSGFASVLFAHASRKREKTHELLMDESGMTPAARQAMRLIYGFQDQGYMQFYVTSAQAVAQGSGKTNFSGYAIELAIGEYGNTESVNIYNPSNFGTVYKRQYKYDTIAEIFIDEPRGRSVANTVIERDARRERTGLKDAKFYSLVVAGEQGGGYAMSHMIQDMKASMQVMRHLGIQMLLSGIQELPPDVIDKFIPGRVEMRRHSTDQTDPDHIGMRKMRFAAHFQQRIPHPSKIVFRDFFVIDSVPKVSGKLYSGDKGFALDTASVGSFSIPDMLKTCGYNDDLFVKDPDKYVDRFSEYAIDKCEKTGIDLAKWTKQQPVPVTSSRKPKIVSDLPENATIDQVL